MFRRAHGGNTWRYKKIIDFSANINPLGTPVQLKELSELIEHYPEPDSSSLKKLLAKIHSLRPENITIGNGSIELIYLLPRVLPIKKVMIPIPSFSEYEFASLACGFKPVFAKQDIETLKKKVTNNSLVFLCNPNNPTGKLFESSQIEGLLSVCQKKSSYLVIDEAFIDFTLKADSFIRRAGHLSNLIVLRSLTKIYALAGLRIGYAVASKGMISRLSSCQYPWNVNSFALAAAKKALGDKAYLKKTRTLIKKEKKYLWDNLRLIKGIEVFESEANYFLCKLKTGTAASLKKKLLKKNILIRDCSNFRGLDKTYFRVAVRKRSENKKLYDCLVSLYS